MCTIYTQFQYPQSCMLTFLVTVHRHFSRTENGRQKTCDFPQYNPLNSTESSGIRHFSVTSQQLILNLQQRTVYEEPCAFAHTSRGTLYFPLNFSTLEIIEQIELHLLRHAYIFQLPKCRA